MFFIIFFFPVGSADFSYLMFICHGIIDKFPYRHGIMHTVLFLYSKYQTAIASVPEYFLNITVLFHCFQFYPFLFSMFFSFQNQIFRDFLFCQLFRLNSVLSVIQTVIKNIGKYFRPSYVFFCNNIFSSHVHYAPFLYSAYFFFICQVSSSLCFLCLFFSLVYNISFWLSIC